MTLPVRRTLDDGRAALRAGDAAGARLIFEPAHLRSPSGETLEGLARVSYLGNRSFQDAVAEYHVTRDSPMCEMTAQFASGDPPQPDMQQLLGAMAGHQEAMNDFIRVMAGSLPAAEFFDPESLRRLAALPARR